MNHRIEKIKNAMAAHGIRTLLACHPKNVYYTSGFYTAARPIWQIGMTCCLISLDGTWTLFLPSPWSDSYLQPPGCTVVEYNGTAEQLAKRILEFWPLNRSEITAADLRWMPVPLFKALYSAMPGLNLIDATLLLDRCRMIKDEGELQRLEQAVSIVDGGLETAEHAVRQGCTELEIQAAVNAAMLLRGSGGNGFTTKVISGSNGSYPHHVAGIKRIFSSDSVIVDLSASISGYESDSARTFLLPDAPPEVLEIHKGISAVLSSVSRKLLPGTPVRELCRYLRTKLAALHPSAIQAGTIGHGVGLFAHEYPDITADSSEILAENMVLAIEPALYVPGKYGVRIENMFHIRSDGAQQMNCFHLNHY